MGTVSQLILMDESFLLLKWRMGSVFFTFTMTGPFILILTNGSHPPYTSNWGMELSSMVEMQRIRSLGITKPRSRYLR